MLAGSNLGFDGFNVVVIGRSAEEPLGESELDLTMWIPCVVRKCLSGMLQMTAVRGLCEDSEVCFWNKTVAWKRGLGCWPLSLDCKSSVTLYCPGTLGMYLAL